MAKIQAGQAVDLLTFSQAEAKIGYIVSSLLDFTAFSDEHLGTWFPLDGRSCVGTAYALASGKTTVPNAIANGEFMRQAKTGRAIGTVESDAIRNITGYHYVTDETNTSGFAGGAFSRSDTPGNSTQPGTTGRSWKSAQFNFDASNVVPTADENRPKNLAVNYYIKVNY